MVFEFCDFVLDEAAYQLRRHGESLKLEPKVFDVRKDCQALVRQTGRPARN